MLCDDDVLLIDLPSAQHLPVFSLCVQASRLISSQFLGLTSQSFSSQLPIVSPTGRSGMQRISVGVWRDNKKNDPMQVVSGAMGKENIHFQAPDAE